MTIEFCPKCNNIICDCPNDDIPTLVIDSITTAQQTINTIQNQTNDRVVIERECEVCSAKGDWFKHCAMYMCPTCRDKEMALSAKNKATESDRVSAAIEDTVARSNQSIIDARESKVVEDIAKEIPIDGSIQVRSDIFNAKTISIIDMKKGIDEDSSIEKKHFALALELRSRFLHLRKVLFDIDESRVSITNEQRSIQTYLNELSNKLRTEEREKIKLKDINYKPVVSKIAKPRIAKKPKLPKFDKAELKRLASETGIPEFTLQTICVAKGIQPTEAADMLKGLQK